NFCGIAAEAVEIGQQAVNEAHRSGNPGWLAYAEYGLGQAFYVAGRYRQAVEVLESAQRQFLVQGAMPPMGGSAAQAGRLCCMMTVLCQVALGNDAAADAAQRMAEQVAAQENRPLAEISAALSRGVLLLSREQPQDAEAKLAAALALARQHEL